MNCYMFTLRNSSCFSARGIADAARGLLRKHRTGSPSRHGRQQNCREKRHLGEAGCAPHALPPLCTRVQLMAAP